MNDLLLLYLPKKFDGNEWFILISSVVIWTVIFILPRRLSTACIVVIWLLNVSLAHSADFIIGKQPFELYAYNDRKEMEWFDLWLHLLSYPPATYLFVYGYDKWRTWLDRKLWRLAAIIGVAALATTGLEAMATYYGVFTYYHWNLYASFAVYVFVYWINLLFYRLLRRELKRDTLLVK